MSKVAFIRKAGTFNELKKLTRKTTAADSFVIEKVIELPEAEFNTFADDLLEDNEIIKAHIDLMRLKDDGWHCILVKANDSRDGILVESEGYDYARYTAYWEDIKRVD